MSARPDHRRLLAGTLAAAAAAVASLAMVPAMAGASVVHVVGDGLLRVGGNGGERNQIVLRFRSTPESPYGGGRFIVFDEAGATVGSPECAAIDPQTVTCGAGKVRSVSAVLGDLDDELLVDTRGGDLMPSRYPVRARAGDGDDVIRGGRGADVIKGEQGRDVIAGATGADRIAGGPGVDAILGNAGDDRLFGGPGTDGIFGQKGRDAMIGGAGIDVLLAKDGKRDRRLDCGPGNADKQRAIVDRFDPKPKRCTTE